MTALYKSAAMTQMWPSTHCIGKGITPSSYFFTSRVANEVPEAYFTAMTEDHHNELALMGLSMIAFALTRHN